MDELNEELAEEAADLLVLMCSKLIAPQAWIQFKDSRIFLTIVDCYIY